MTDTPQAAARPNATPRWRATFAVLVLATVVRLAYLAQLRESILFANPQGDAQLHFDLAREIAAGDWLGNKVFYYAPLYPYFVAVIFAACGTSMIAVVVLQAILSVLDVWLVILLGERIFGRRVGLIAGGVAACYGPAVFYTGFLLKETLGLVLLDAFVVVALALAARRTWWASFLPGFLLGLAALVRPNLLPLALPAALWLAIECCATAARGVWTAALFVAGVAAALAPVAARNRIVSGEMVLISAHGGHNFFMGNRVGATGVYEPLFAGGGQMPLDEERDARSIAEQATGRPMTASQVSAYWYGRGWREIRKYPGNFIRVTCKKFALFWNDYEVPDVQDFYYVRRACPALWLAPFTFGIIAPLAGVGVFASLRQWRSCVLPYLVVAGVLATVVPFFIFARYRLPVVSVLIVFAGAGVARTAELFASRDGRRLAVSLAVAAGVAAFTNWPIYRPIAYIATSYFNVGQLHREAGHAKEAIAAWREAVRLNPAYRKPWRALGEAYFEAGRFADAVAAFRHAAVFAPAGYSADAELTYKMAVSCWHAGERDTALELFRIGRALWPNDERFQRAPADIGQPSEGSAPP